MVKPGGIIANVNYLGEGDFVKIPRAEWGCGMAHKQIRGGLMPGGRLRTERLLRLIETKRVDPSLLLTHKFYGFSHVEQALYPLAGCGRYIAERNLTHFKNLRKAGARLPASYFIQFFPPMQDK